jgi:hypothetical protein
MVRSKSSSEGDTVQAWTVVIDLYEYIAAHNCVARVDLEPEALVKSD